MPKKEKLVRRTIADTLKREYGWDVVSHVDGAVDVREPKSPNAAAGFTQRVREAVKKMNFEPRIVIHRDRAGDRWIRFTTEETVAQAGRGAHSS
jgi:hypothetical protein